MNKTLGITNAAAIVFVMHISDFNVLDEIERHSEQALDQN